MKTFVSHVSFGFFRLIAFASIAVFGQPAASASGLTYHVATSGDDDTGDGSSAKPWKTIQKAANLMAAGDTCLIHGGIYRETVVPARSGKPDHPITFQAAPGEKVTVSGCDVVTGWAPHSGAIYKKTGLALSLDGLMNQIFVDGEPMVLARWPNRTNSSIWDMEYTTATGGAVQSLVDSEHLTQPDNYWVGALLCVEQSGNAGFSNGGWYQIRTTVTGSSQSEHSLTTVDYDPHTPPPGKGAKYFLCNKLECLDAPKEWYYDRQQSVLYLQTPKGDNPGGHLVEAKQRLYGFNLDGRAYITIKDINLFACTIVCRGDANHCNIDHINADYYWWSMVENTNWIYRDSGIVLLGSYNTLRNSVLTRSSDDGVVLGGVHNNVINNLIQDVAYGGLQAMGVRIRGGWNLASHNTIHDVGKNGIGSVTNGLYHCVIEYNSIANTSRMANDMGAIYIGGLATENTEFHHNIAHDPSPTAAYTSGFYFDGDTNGLIVYRNIIYGHYTVANLQVNHPCEDSLFINNTLYDYSKIWADLTWSWSSNIGCYFVNNICVDRCDIPDWGAIFTHNLTSGDPRLANPPVDFTPKPGSPCIDAGMVFEGVTEGYAGKAPDIGAVESGAPDWQRQVGHNFENPPDAKWSAGNFRFRNRVENPSFERYGAFQPSERVPTLPGDLKFDPLDGWNKSGPNWSTADVVRTLRSPAFPIAPSGTADFIRYAVAKQSCHSLKLSSGAGISQTISGLTPNTTYRVRMFMRSDNLSECQLGVRDFGGEDTSKSGSSHDWSEVTFTFKTGSSNTSAVLYISKPARNSICDGFAYVDDVGLTEEPAVPVVPNIPVSDYFETPPWVIPIR